MNIKMKKKKKILSSLLSRLSLAFVSLSLPEPLDLDLEEGFWNISALKPDLVERISRSFVVPLHFQNTKKRKKEKKQKLKSISFAFETKKSQLPATTRTIFVKRFALKHVCALFMGPIYNYFIFSTFSYF